MGLQRMSQKNIAKINSRAEGVEIVKIWGGSGYIGNGWFIAETDDGTEIVVKKDGTFDIPPWDKPKEPKEQMSTERLEDIFELVAENLKGK